MSIMKLTAPTDLIFKGGYVVNQYFNKSLPFTTHVSEQYDEYIITRCICKAVKIGNETFATLVSELSRPLTGMQVDHEWIIFEARKPNSKDICLVAQSFKDTLGLHIVENERQGDEIGLVAGGRLKDEITDVRATLDITIDRNHMSIGQLKEYMQEKNKPYSLAFNNCQQFAQNLCDKFAEDEDLPIEKASCEIL